MKPVRLCMRVTRQRDDFGCGYCACASVYRYYDLDPVRLRLRRRLGTGVSLLPRLVPFRSGLEKLGTAAGLDTKGTWCPDVFTVLAVDGFEVSYACGDYRKPLRHHLRSGHPALALFHGLSHWIVAAGIDDKGVLVLDSSGFADPSGRNRLRYTLTHSEFDDAVDGVLLVRRQKRARRQSTAMDYATAYVRGTAFALQCLGKLVPRSLRLAKQGPCGR